MFGWNDDPLPAGEQPLTGGSLFQVSDEETSQIYNAVNAVCVLSSTNTGELRSRRRRFVQCIDKYQGRLPLVVERYVQAIVEQVAAADDGFSSGVDIRY